MRITIHPFIILWLKSVGFLLVIALVMTLGFGLLWISERLWGINGVIVCVLFLASLIFTAIRYIEEYE
jgi:hypothetical protein